MIFPIILIGIIVFGLYLAASCYFSKQPSDSGNEHLVPVGLAIAALAFLALILTPVISWWFA